MLLKKVLLATALCVTAVIASAGEWYVLGPINNGKTLSATFADKSTVRCKNGICKMWTRTIYYPAANGYNNSTYLFEYDCAEFKARRLVANAYNYDQFVLTDNRKYPWEYVTPDSLGEFELKLACGKVKFNEERFWDTSFSKEKIERWELTLVEFYKFPLPAHAKKK